MSQYGALLEKERSNQPSPKYHRRHRRRRLLLLERGTTRGTNGLEKRK